MFLRESEGRNAKTRRDSFAKKVALYSIPMALLVRASEFMGLDLEVAGYSRWRNYKEAANIKRFNAFYGALPKSCENIWLDLQTTTRRLIRASVASRVVPIRSFFFWAFDSCGSIPQKKTLL